MSRIYDPLTDVSEAIERAQRSLDRCAVKAHLAVEAEQHAIAVYDGSRAGQARLAAAMSERHAACVEEKRAEAELHRLRRWQSAIQTVSTTPMGRRLTDTFGVR